MKIWKVYSLEFVVRRDENLLFDEREEMSCFPLSDDTHINPFFALTTRALELQKFEVTTAI